MADGLELRVTPPSSSEARVTSASHLSKSSSFSTLKRVSIWMQPGGGVATYDCAEELVDLTCSLFPSVVNLGNTAAPGGQHFVAYSASCGELWVGYLAMMRVRRATIAW